MNEWKNEPKKRGKRGPYENENTRNGPRSSLVKEQEIDGWSRAFQREEKTWARGSRDLGICISKRRNALQSLINHVLISVSLFMDVEEWIHGYRRFQGFHFHTAPDWSLWNEVILVFIFFFVDHRVVPCRRLWRNQRNGSNRRLPSSFRDLLSCRRLSLNQLASAQQGLARLSNTCLLVIFLSISWGSTTTKS